MAVILSFSTPDPAPLIAELRRSGLLTAEPPRDVNSGRGLQATWPEGYLGRGESSVLARMPDWSQVVLDLQSQVVQLTLPRLLSMADPRALCQSGGTLASSAAAASMHEVRGTLPVGHAPHMDDTSFRV
ncbi:MAG: hypothetical protein K1X94_20110, partial [Sandaracinaceae bacterium]|nr:hypothetical protein [Sandaracinaceae bacterium]